MINQSRGCFFKKTRTATTTRTDASLCVERIHVTEIIHVADEEIKDDTIYAFFKIYFYTHLVYDSSTNISIQYHFHLIINFCTMCAPMKCH